MRRFALLILFALAPFAARADDRLLSYWTQIGPDGAAEARALVSGQRCPTVYSFGSADFDERAPIEMKPRAPATADFPLACEAMLPEHIASAWIGPDGFAEDPRQISYDASDRGGKKHHHVNGWPLPVWKREPERILVLGDTGCRLKGDTIQACNDPLLWPFPTLAGAAAKLRPDLIVHVGDYLYRETACPAGNAGCAGSPYGDNDWASWKADWFDPAAPLFAAAPMVLVRGNHEDCGRAGPSYLRMMGPYAFDPAAPCATHQPPYTVPLGPMNLVVMDNADAPDTSVDDTLVPTYKTEFGALRGETPIWLAMHRPIWGAISGPLGIPAGGNATMIAALGKDGIPPPVAFLLAGHIHTFEAINYTAKVPPQIVAGNGGDWLDPAPDDLKGTIFTGNSGVKVSSGVSLGGFGFLLMTKLKDRWNIDVYDSDATYERQCVFAAGRVACPPPGTKK